MKSLNAFIITFLLITASSLIAEEVITSGIPLNKPVPAYQLLDITGNYSGKNTCYTWNYGIAPVIAIFAKDIDDDLISLISIVDAYTKKHEKKALSAYALFTEGDIKSLRPKLETISKNRKLTIPLTFADNKKEIEKLNLNSKVKYTIIVYKDRLVKANFAVNKIDLNLVMKVIDSAENSL